MLNPCIQCGKPRIDGKSWKEKSGTSVIIHTETICPDASCQKIVNKAIEERKAKSELLLKKKLDAKQLKDSQLAAN